MTKRDDIYIQILQHGLLQIRNFAAIGYLEYCAVESDHLHNVPSLIGETNEQRHLYYFCTERVAYLEQVVRSIPDVDFTLHQYEELWADLRVLNNIPEP